MSDIRIADTGEVWDGTGTASRLQVEQVDWRGAQGWICGFAAHWPGATGWYQIDWGDGSDPELAHPDLPARRHSYTTRSACDNLSGTVTVRELIDRHGTTGPVRAEATVQTRGRGNPGHRFTVHPDGRTVRAELGPYEPPHGWSVDWGDGSAPQHLPDGQRTVEHTYPAGEPSRPVIGLLDRPARRLRWFTGPEINRTKKGPTGMTFSAVYTPDSQWWGGYSGNYRITNNGPVESAWELSFTLADPAKIQDVWGAGELKRQENRQHKPDLSHPHTPTDPVLALYREPEPAGAGTAYVIRCTRKLKPGESVDVGFRVEAPGQQQAPEPNNCSVNGNTCTGGGGDDTEPPTVPTNVKAVAVGPRAVTLSWTESTDDTGVRKYQIAVDGDVWADVPAPASGGSAARLDPETEYEFKVRAVDMAGNTSLWSDPVSATTTKEDHSSEKKWLAKVAPFVDMCLWPTPDLAKFADESGLKAFNLGFIVAASGSDATATWGGYSTYKVADGWGKENIAALKAKDGHYPVISFGGETGTEIAVAAKDADEAYAQYKQVITTYGFDTGPAHIDFDIEGGAQLDRNANARRGAAIARLQKDYPDLRVAFTLPVLPEGLVHDGLTVLRDTVATGARVDLVNIMAMYFFRQEDMGQLTKQAMDSLHGQLAEFYPGMTAKQRWAKVSVCPMVGQCGDGSIFSLDHADQIAAYAQEKGIGQLTYWEAGRDRNACLSGALYQCTNIPQEPWDFARRFGVYQASATKSGA